MKFDEIDRINIAFAMGCAVPGSEKDEHLDGCGRVMRDLFMGYINAVLDEAERVLAERQVTS